MRRFSASPGPRPGIPAAKRAVRTTFALVVASGAALTSAQPLPLAEAQRIAAGRSAMVASQRALVQSAGELVGPAGELPDAKLVAGLENVPAEGRDRFRLDRDGMTMARIGVMQEFPRAEKLRARTERARRDAERSAVAVDTAVQAVHREVAAAWIARWAGEREARAIAAQIDEAKLQAELAAAMYRGGRAAQADVLAASAQTIELANRQAEAELGVERARSALARYLGADADRPLADAPRFDELPPAARGDAGVAGQPDIRLARAQEAVLDAEAALAGTAKLVDWSAELSYGIRGPDFPNMVSLMVRVDLPWSPSTRQDRIQLARLHERDAARAAREDLERSREAEVRQTRADWRVARERAERIARELVPLADRRVEAALAAYRGGGGAIGAVLDARRAQLDTRIAQIAADAAAARAWGWLTTLTVAEE